jgi:hypothetical protein
MSATELEAATALTAEVVGGGVLQGVEPELSFCLPMPDWLLEERVKDVMLFVEELIRQQP